MGTPLHVVALAEARELLSVLRRNRRFGYFLAFAASSQPSEHPFVKEIKLLRDSIIEHHKVDTSVHLHESAEHLVSDASLRRMLEPFLHVVTSRDASGLITGVALQSIERIVSCLFHLISVKSEETLWKEYVPTLNLVVDSIAACRFDVTDPAADEVVLSRITSVISRVATSPVAYHLSDAALLRGIEACLGIASGRRRASELLRRTAEYALCNIANSLGNCTRLIASSSATSSTSMDTIVNTLSFDASASNPNGAAYTQTFSTEGFDESGPLSGTIIAALILVVCRMAEAPSSSSPDERILGLQMLSSLLTFGGQDLMRIPSVRDVLLRDCSRVVLRCVGSFKSSLSEIAASFTSARLLVHALGNECVGFVAALLEDVYPCYVAGVENAKAAAVLDSAQGNTNGIASHGGKSNGLPSNSSMSGDLASKLAVELDPVVREVGLESLADLLSTPGLLSSLYAVVDCDIKCEDVVGPLLRGLGKATMAVRPRKRSKRLRNSSSSGARVPSVLSSAESDEEDSALMAGGNADASRVSRSAAILCAEAVLSIVRGITERLDQQAELVLPTANGKSTSALNVEARRRMKNEKVCALRIAMAFNSQPRISRGEKLIAFLREHKPSVSPDLGDTVQEELDNCISECVKFLRETRGLNKEMVGAILGEPDDISRRILASFTATFNFRNRRFTDSFRVYLESFRLPGEAQKIDRIVECFSNSFYAQNRSSTGLEDNSGSSDDSIVGLFKNADAVYTLTFSTVMLNTDLYNDSIRKKMSLDDFVSNNRGTNDGQDFPRWFLEQIFESISSAEIKMKGEAGMEAITSAHWDEYIEDMRSRKRRLLESSEGNNFDEDIFALCWQSAVAAANVTLIEAGDENQAQKALEGFVSVARCGAAFHQSRPVDIVVTSLVNASGIREGPLLGAVYRFGTDIKAQMAARVLSDVIGRCGDFLRNDGWQALVSYILRLHALNLLPDDVEKSLGGNGTDLHVHGVPLPKSRLVPNWWPSQDSVKNENETDDEEKSKKPPRAKGFIAAFFAASIGSDASSDEELDYGEGEAEWPTVKGVKVSNTPPSYLKSKTTEEIAALKLARECIIRCRVEDILIGDAKILRSDALFCLTKAIARTVGRILDVSGGFPNGSSKDRSTDVVCETDANGEEIKEVGAFDDGSSDDVHADSFLLNLAEFVPSSPRDDSSAIVGVSPGIRRDSSSVELDYHGFSGNGLWTGASRDRDEKKAREFVVAFCIDLLCNLTLQNRDRLHIPWPALNSVLVRIIAPATKPSALLERAVIALLRVATRLLHRDELHTEVLRTLNLIVQLPADAFSALSNPIAAGLHNLVKSHGANIASTSGWHAIFSIIENMPRCPSNAVDTALKLLSFVMAEKSALNAVCPQTFAPILDAIMAFVTNGSVSASLEALDLLYLLSRRIPDVVQVEKPTGQENEKTQDVEVWNEFWGPTLKGFAHGAQDPRGKVRNEALVALEKVLAVCGTEVLSADQWKLALSTVVFPLMKQLFSTHGFLKATVEAERTAQQRLRVVSSGSGSGRSRRTLSAVQDEQLLKSVSAACKKTRLRALMLTSKTFLQHHATIAAGLSSNEFTELWLGVLNIYRVALVGDEENEDALPLATESDELREHVPESVKNLMLVMSASELLVESDTERWKATFELIQTFLPDTVADIQSLASMSHTNDGDIVSVEASA